MIVPPSERLNCFRLTDANRGFVTFERSEKLEKLIVGFIFTVKGKKGNHHRCESAWKKVNSHNGILYTNYARPTLTNDRTMQRTGREEGFNGRLCFREKCIVYRKTSPDLLLAERRNIK